MNPHSVNKNDFYSPNNIHIMYNKGITQLFILASLSTPGRRIPKSKVEFHNFTTRFINYLKEGEPSNAVRLGVLDEEVNYMEKLKIRWDPYYDQYCEGKATTTLLCIKTMNNIIDEFIEYDHVNHILDRIKASPNVTIEDLEVCNIHSALFVKSRSRQLTQPISVGVVPSFMVIGHCVLQFICGNTENKSIKILKKASCVECAYTIGGEDPTSKRDVDFHYHQSTKARFQLKFEEHQAGQKLFIKFRWINSKYPDFAGPWSEIHQMYIL